MSTSHGVDVQHFESLLHAVKNCGLSFAQAQRLAAALRPSLEPEGGGLSSSSAGLSDLKLSMRSRLASRAQTTQGAPPAAVGPDAACRSQTAATESGAPPAARRPRRAGAAQQRPRERPPWNGDDGSDDDDGDGGRGASSSEHHAPEPARARQPEWQSDVSHAPPVPDDDDALPNGWTSHLDQKRGREYYHHKDRGETTWHRPAPQSPPPRQDNIRPAPPSEDDDNDDATRHSRTRSDQAHGGGGNGAPAATAEGRHRTLWRPVAPDQAPR
ncbi:hypothetical protein M885DRAFT_558215 [Pelagophyceae sp. CCMP2097]|nr:hypothetical protein M885DRAFT_558215 [Pelagophyceae sp. CCMP2097]